MNIVRAGVWVVSGLMAIGSAGAALAQAGDSSTGDKTFLMDAGEGNLAEIQASKLALKKSKNADVKAYAQQMIDDHMKLMADMKPLNDQMGVMPPAQLNATHQAEAKRLMAMSGSAFDVEYVKAMATDHHKTLAEMKNEQQTTQNDQIKTALSTAIPIVQDHTDKIDAMAQKMNVAMPSMGQ